MARVELAPRADTGYVYSPRVQLRSVSVRRVYTCSCPLGFTSSSTSANKCDMRVNMCYSSPCGSHGLCLSVEAAASGFVCLCDQGFVGAQCETRVDALRCDIMNATLTTTTAKRQQKHKQQQEASHQSNKWCKHSSVCKKLILGGVVCDACDLMSNQIEAQQQQQQEADDDVTSRCELRTRHFPGHAAAELAVALEQSSMMSDSRYSFKITLTFATVAAHARLFFNARSSSSADVSLGVGDFVELRIVDGRLVFAYSLGERTATQWTSAREGDDQWPVVSDGKWRTFTVAYHEHEFELTLGDAMPPGVSDACQLASAHGRDSMWRCFRARHTHRLASACASQAERCFRSFDLNGAFYLGGRSSLSSSSNNTGDFYVGCIKDVHINERFVDLHDEQLVLNTGTLAGCAPKKDTCALKQNCKHVWAEQVVLASESNRSSSSTTPTVSLNGRGELRFAAIQRNNHDVDDNSRKAASTVWKFDMRLADNNNKPTLLLFQLRLLSSKVGLSSLYLIMNKIKCDFIRI